MSKNILFIRLCVIFKCNLFDFIHILRFREELRKLNILLGIYRDRYLVILMKNVNVDVMQKKLDETNGKVAKLILENVSTF